MNDLDAHLYLLLSFQMSSPIGKYLTTSFSTSTESDSL